MATPSRRGLLQGAGASFALAGGQPAHAKPVQDRPNILWLVSEDNNPWIGAYGDALAHTPNLDALAREGLLFKNVYCNAPVCAPSRFGIITGVLPEACAPAQHMRAKGPLPAAFLGFPRYLRERGYYCTNNAKTDYNCDLDPATVWNESSAKAHWRGRAPGQPFFAAFNNETSHESRLFKRTEGKVEPKDVRLPAYLPDTPDVRGDFASYYNLIERMDGEIGQKLAELEAEGLSEDTIVFYYSDNGGVLPRSKRYCYDEGLRCAMIVRVPARWRHLAPAAPGAKIDRPVSYIDLAPTVLALAGIEPPSYMHGAAFMGARRQPAKQHAFGMRNRMDERYDFVRTVTDGRYRYIRNYMPHRPWGMHGAYEWLAKGYQDWDRAYRAGRLNPVQARFFGPKPFEEFYDLGSDPDQIDNLIAAPTQAHRIAALRSALDEHMLRINDNGFIPEGSPLEGFEASRAPGAYPLRAVMQRAAIAARCSVGEAPALAAGLNDANDILRHWAAQGLLMLGPAAQPYVAGLAERMRTDALIPTRICAAEALAALDADPEALPFLAGLLREDQSFPNRLYALNALTALGPRAGPALPDIAKGAQAANEYVRSASRYLKASLEGEFEPSMKIFTGPTGAPA